MSVLTKSEQALIEALNNARSITAMLRAFDTHFTVTGRGEIGVALRRNTARILEIDAIIPPTRQ